MVGHDDAEFDIMNSLMIKASGDSDTTTASS
jgi:hypothetical protein